MPGGEEPCVRAQQAVCDPASLRLKSRALTQRQGQCRAGQHTQSICQALGFGLWAWSLLDGLGLVWVRKQEDSWEAPSTIPCFFHRNSSCRADRPWQADLTGSTLFSFLGRDNKVSWCIKCHLMDPGGEGILHLGANINTAWCLTLWRVIPVLLLKMSLNRNWIL